ncbi:MAG: enoyl-CoA hydratase/isomerase family protein [Betaproteobacteria bacterium]|nr:enoyl-CoA hydratase/isomerase family protein [Betaproteobacteria bacterium]
MSLILTERRAATVVLTINRPESLNAISEAMANELERTLDALAADASARCVVIRGAGERAFSAGSDLKERRGLDAEAKWKQARSLWRVNRKLYDFPKPTIAAIRGWCLGGGLELALYCDLRIAAGDSTFGWPEMTLGAYPGSGGPIILPRIIGVAAAKQFLLFDHRIAAARALQIGLVQEVVAAGSELERALALAERVTNVSPGGAAAVKRLLNESAALTMDDADALNVALRRPLEATADYAEGIEAHYEKRKPRFTGR